MVRGGCGRHAPGEETLRRNAVRMAIRIVFRPGERLCRHRDLVSSRAVRGSSARTDLGDERAPGTDPDARAAAPIRSFRTETAPAAEESGVLSDPDVNRTRVGLQRGWGTHMIEIIVGGRSWWMVKGSLYRTLTEAIAARDS